ncbi:MAG: hypothetical protein V1706_11925 [Pseudomonadota bacterium]
MKEKIDQVIAYEIKRDMADRYFGFRKLIEDDRLELENEIRMHSFILEKRISFDLIRIYIILKDESLIDQFLSLTTFDKQQFYDPFFTESRTIMERVFVGIKEHGLTRAGRFENLLMDCYDRLEFHTRHYRQKFEELKEANRNLAEEIEVFHLQNDLGSMLGFLRSLGNSKKIGNMEGGMEIGIAQSLEKKMSIDPPLPIEHHLPLIEPLPPLDKVEKTLKKLADQAYKLHDEETLKFLTSKKTAAER